MNESKNVSEMCICQKIMHQKDILRDLAPDYVSSKTPEYFSTQL